MSKIFVKITTDLWGNLDEPAEFDALQESIDSLNKAYNDATGENRITILSVYNGVVYDTITGKEIGVVVNG